MDALPYTKSYACNTCIIHAHLGACHVQVAFIPYILYTCM